MLGVVDEGSHEQWLRGNYLMLNQKLQARVATQVQQHVDSPLDEWVATNLLIFGYQALV